MKRALVTGASGLVGSHLVEMLNESGDIQIRVLARETSNLRWVQGINFEKHIGDVTQPSAELQPAVEGVDVVYHVAGAVKALRKRTLFDVNAQGTENLLQACANLQTPPRRFVLVSSAGAAGPSLSDAPLTEDVPPRPVTPYGRSKLAAENIAEKFQQRMSIAVLRPGAIYGPRDTELLPAFRAVKSGLAARLGVSHRRFNLCHVRDVARAIMLAGSVEAAGSETFMIGGLNTDQSELVSAIAKVMEKKRVFSPPIPKFLIYFAALLSSAVGQITRKPRIFTWGNARRLLAKNWTMDCSKAERILGFRPNYNLDTGVRDTIDWYRKHGML
ncbi:NAD-dependent epimerase/dehydratase family protein [Myxococcota bacterium]